jgi:hypothetical protein
MLLAVRLGDGSIIELLDDFITDVPRLEAGDDQYISNTRDMKPTEQTQRHGQCQ